MWKHRGNAGNFKKPPLLPSPPLQSTGWTNRHASHYKTSTKVKKKPATTAGGLVTSQVTHPAPLAGKPVITAEKSGTLPQSAEQRR